MTNEDAMQLFRDQMRYFPGGATKGALLEGVCSDAGVEFCSPQWGYFAAIMDEFLRTEARCIGETTHSGGQSIFVVAR